MINKKSIIDAYTTIRKENNSIHDEVLDFMSQSAITEINQDSEAFRALKLLHDDLLDRAEYDADGCRVVAAGYYVWSNTKKVLNRGEES